MTAEKKKQYLRQALILFFLTGIAFACMKDEQVDAIDGALTLNNAQDWYKDVIDNIDSNSIGFRSGKGNNKIELQPKWDRSQTSKNGTYEVIETVLTSDVIFNIADDERVSKFQATNDGRYLLSKTQLVIRLNRKTGEIDGFIMTFMPSLSYLESTKFDPFKKNSYLDRDKKFCGYILYHDMKGNFVNGWRYDNGDIYAIPPSEEGDLEIGLRAGCSTAYIAVTSTYQYGTIEYESGVAIYTINLATTTTYVLANLCDDDTGSGGLPAGDFSGGGAGGVSVIPSPDLIKIIKKHSLTSDQLKKINEFLEDLLKECGFKFMYEQIIGNKYFFNDIKIDPNLSSHSAAYNADTGILSFYNSSSINADYFREEFVHLYQTAIHGKTMMGFFQNFSRGNAEFEAKVIQDLLCSLRGAGCWYFGAGRDYGASYTSWIISLTSNGTRFPNTNDILNTTINGKGYWDFLKDFLNKPGSYNGLPYSQSYNPKALTNLDSSKINACNK